MTHTETVNDIASVEVELARSPIYLRSCFPTWFLVVCLASPLNVIEIFLDYRIMKVDLRNQTA